MSTPYIEFKQVSFAYDASRPILTDISLCIEQGHFTAIMGGSGSGKTTLLRLITGQIKPVSGQVLIHGQDLSQFSEAELYQHRRNMGVLFQFGALFTDLSVFENVAFPLKEHTALPRALIRDLVTLKLNAVGLRGTDALMPTELSGGMARRVALARTIALDPELMLYDEPFTGLDPISLGVIAHLIARINKALNATSVMVTHDITQSLKIVDQVIFLADGAVAFAGTPAQTYATDNAWVQQFIHGAPEGPVDYRFQTQRSLEQDLMRADA